MKISRREQGIRVNSFMTEGKINQYTKIKLFSQKGEFIYVFNLFRTVGCGAT